MHINSNITPTSGSRGRVGVGATRCESTFADAQVTTENLAAAQGRLADAEVAAAMVAFARAQIRRQVDRGVVAHADGAPQTTLRLLE